MIAQYILQNPDKGELQPIIASLYTKIAGNYKIKRDYGNAISYSAKVYDMMKKMLGKNNE